MRTVWGPSITSCVMLGVLGLETPVLSIVSRVRAVGVCGQTREPGLRWPGTKSALGTRSRANASSGAVFRPCLLYYPYYPS
jgi:hypothetical protein